MNQLAKRFSHLADFAGIYLMEAHAADQWPLGNHCVVNQHRTAFERITAARNFVARFGYNCPMFADTIDNEFNSLFAAWPERFFIVQNNTLQLVAMPSMNNEGFDIGEVNRWLVAYELKASA